MDRNDAEGRFDPDPLEKLRDQVADFDCFAHGAPFMPRPDVTGRIAG
jgi:hypothetical protein